MYEEMHRKHGGAYTIGGAEFCSYAEYSCPFCGASDRDRLIAVYVENLIRTSSVRQSWNVVEFAPSGPMRRLVERLSAEHKGFLRWRTADMMMKGVDDPGVDICNMKIYQDGQFDLFICSHVLEHVADDRAAMRELWKILKPGGRGVLLVPIQLSVQKTDEDPNVTDIGERWRRFGQDDHVRMYAKQDFLQRLTDAGFTVEQLGVKDFGRLFSWRLRLAPNSNLYVVHKSGL